MTSVLRTRIKICGICRAQDAFDAAGAGADAIGIVLHSASGRYVTPAQAALIVGALPPLVSAVGLFVDASVAEIRAVLAEVPLGAVQLHGNESAELAAALKPIPVIKAIRVDAQLSQTVNQWRQATAELKLTNLIGLVMETATPQGGAPGGTGIVNDWNRLAGAQTSGAFDGMPSLIAAGGLTPQNVGDVVRLIRPYAVDVSSGVEGARREKSPDRIRAFIRAVRDADGIRN